MIYVIADDLTGANDTGVQLSKKGYKTVVSIALSLNDTLDSYFNKYDKIDVLVLDTETRDLNSEAAREKVKQIIKKLNICNKNNIIYKKIDSTFRGNIGSEINVIMNSLGIDVCIITPSFPSNNRITVGGYLVIGDEPLGTSQYYYGENDPANVSFIPYLLEQQIESPVGLIELKDVMKGEKSVLKRIDLLYKKGIKIMVADATTDYHLKEILNGSSGFSGSVLYAGSAGLANYLSNIYKKKQSPDTKLKGGDSPVLTVVGSRNLIMNSQVDYLKNKKDVYDLIINPVEILANRNGLIVKNFTDAVKAAENDCHLVLRPDPSCNNKDHIDSILNKYDLNIRELEVIIRNFLGFLAAKIIRATSINNIIITGGDTAIGLCQALGINSLIIMDEVLPGIPLSLAENYQNNCLQIITKAGGFGREDTLDKLLNKFKHRKEANWG